MQGPAQNVPKPVMPEDGYKLATVEGLEKSVHAWVNWKTMGFKRVIIRLPGNLFLHNLLKKPNIWIPLQSIYEGEDG